MMSKYKNLLVISSIVIIAAGVAAAGYFWYVNKFRTGEKATMEDACNNIPKDAVRNRFYITISAADIDEIKKEVEKAIELSKGKINSFNDGTFSPPPYGPDYSPVPKSPPTRSVSFMAAIPQDEFKSFADAIHKLGEKPNSITNENIATESYEALLSQCQNMQGELLFLKEESKKKEYNDNFDTHYKIISIRQAMAEFQRGLETAEVSITIISEDNSG